MIHVRHHISQSDGLPSASCRTTRLPTQFFQVGRPTVGTNRPIYMTHTCLFALSQLPRAILGSYHRLACINHQYAGIRHPITPRKGDQPPNAVDATTDCITNLTMTDKQPPSPKNEPTSQTAKPNRFLSTAYHRAPIPPPPIDPRSACRANNAKPTWAGDGRFVCMEYIPQWILFGQSLFRHCKPRMLY